MRALRAQLLQKIRGQKAQKTDGIAMRPMRIPQAIAIVYLPQALIAYPPTVNHSKRRRINIRRRLKGGVLLLSKKRRLGKVAQSPKPMAIMATD